MLKDIIKFIHPVYRTLIIYLVLLVVMRIMGKRELGKLSPFDFVVAIVIAELAAIPMDEDNINLLHGIVPIITLVVAEVFFSWLSMRNTKIRKIMNGTPSIVVQKGHILEKQMRKIRYNINDLISQLREKGYANIDEVEYAILENSGHLSVIPKVEKRPVNPKDLDLHPPYEGMPVSVIIDGEINQENMNLAGLDRLKLKDLLIAQGVKDEKEVFLASLDPHGKLYVSKRGKSTN